MITTYIWPNTYLKRPETEKNTGMIDIAVDWGGQVICHLYQMFTHEFVNATQVQIT